MHFRSQLKFSFTVIVLILFTFLNAHAEGLMVPLVPVDANKMAIAPWEDIRGWNSNLNLVDTSWTECNGGPGGIGFDDSGDYFQFMTLNIAPQMQGNQNTCFVRSKFTLTSALLNELDYMSLGVRYDDGFIAYLNGERIWAENDPQNPGWRSSASQPHEAQSMVWFDVSDHVDKLVPGENLFAVHGMNVESGSPDFLIQFELVARKNYENNFVSDLPILKISSDGNIPVNSNTVRNGTIEIINNGTGNEHRLTDPANDYSGRLAITENSTIYEYPKNHYIVTLKDDVGATANASLLGLPATDEWIFYAPYNDKTLLRNVLMGEIAHQMGRGPAPKLCHLFINDGYVGLYALGPKKKRHENAINISQPGDDGDALTGGYILELGKDRVAPGFNSPLLPFFGATEPIRYLYNFPADENLTAAQQEYIQSFMNAFEADVVNSIDIASAVDYFLLNEISKNVDAYRDHTLLYKDRDSINPKMFITGPLDYNNACGNIRAYNGTSVKGWLFDYVTTPANMSADSMLVPLWWQQLFDDVTFTSALYKRWDALQNDVLNEDYVIEKLDSLYSLVDNDAILNFERWPVAGKPIEPNGKVGDTYDEDFDYLYLWMVDRLDWMRAAMEDFITSVESPDDLALSFELGQNYPNPFNPSTTISYQLAQAGHVSVKIYDIRGVQVAELVNASQSAGRYSVTWNADGYPSGIYLYEITAGDFSQTNRMLLIR
jgi:hypothetical protein